MGSFERNPRSTYLRWARRLNRLITHQSPLPPNDLKVISDMVAILQTTGNVPSSHILAIGLFALGNIYRILGYTDVANALYCKVLNHNPKHIPALYNLGNHYMRVKEFRRAIECYHSVLAIEPDQYETHVNLAAVLGERGDWKEGIVYLLQAIIAFPDKRLAYEALSRHCQNHSGFGFSLHSFNRMLRGHPQKQDLFRFFLREFQIGYYPFMGTQGVFIERGETADIALDLLRAHLVADLADATAIVIGTKHSAASFRNYLQVLESLYRRASRLHFHEVRFSVHFLRSQVYAGQCIEAFSWTEREGTIDYMQEPLSFILMPDEAKEVFGELDCRAAAYSEMDQAFRTAMQEGIVRKIDRTQLFGALIRNLIHLSVDEDVEKCIFYIEAERAMLQGEIDYIEIQQSVARSLREHIRNNEALVCFYVYEIVVDILMVIIVTADRVVSYRRALDFTKTAGLEPRHFITAHQEGLNSISQDVESPFWNVLIEPLQQQLEGIQRLTFVPYLYLRNIPIHLIGENASLWNTSNSRTYSYLPSVRLLERRKISPNTKLHCLIIAFGGGNAPLNTSREINLISDYFDEVTVASDLDEPKLVSDIERGQFDYIHIACHCDFDPNRREFYLVLANGRRYLGSKDLLPKLGAYHIFLNACATGKDLYFHPYGDELITMASVLLRDSVRSVVCTYWPVSDEIAVVMAESYYRHLAGTKGDCALALFQAQQEVRHDPELSDREGWGAYIVLG